VREAGPKGWQHRPQAKTGHASAQRPSDLQGIGPRHDHRCRRDARKAGLKNEGQDCIDKYVYR
jgi:hypothetical protein